MQSGVAEPKSRVVILMVVQTVDCFLSAIIAAGTGIALNAREMTGKNGYRQEKNSCLSLIFMSSLPFLIPLTNCACISLRYCILCCFKQHGVYLTALVMTLSGLGHRQV